MASHPPPLPTDAVEEFYKKAAVACCDHHICVDVFAMAHQYVDLATLGVVAKFTGGQAYYYPEFRAQRDGEKLRAELTHCMSRFVGFEAVTRIRCSRGLEVPHFYGHFFLRSADLLSFSNVDQDKALAVEFNIDESLANQREVFVQVAVLFTMANGERRIRAHTVRIPVVSNLFDMYRFVDTQAAICLWAKTACDQMSQTSFGEIRSQFEKKLAKSLANYAAVCPNRAMPSPTGAKQLMIPDTMKYFPMYLLGLLKSPLLRAVGDMPPDQRAAAMFQVMTLPVRLLIAYAYPRLFALHSLPPEALSRDAQGTLVRPPLVRLTREKIETTGIYLLENGQQMLIWVGRQANPTLVDALLVAAPAPSPASAHDQLARHRFHQPRYALAPASHSEPAARLNALIDSLRGDWAGMTQQPLQVYHEEDEFGGVFFGFLIEDTWPNQLSYPEFLTHIHGLLGSM
ncbi:putative Protein transport protein Sec24B [Paratrimastix pyriformis]|uniref:Uncharacterized protein n=1 Tax=Paratrimastix pyriformis TaxID=342808 RepID=A0ABQ8UA89_9EUKA|nr:putative Protein transport protein Sec24B [Paratrimastix pyriformis]